jgi:hypothetical protein
MKEEEEEDDERKKGGYLYTEILSKQKQQSPSKFDFVKIGLKLPSFYCIVPQDLQFWNQ